MFREMRRIKQQLTEEESREILKTGETGILGLLGDEGYPYTVPVNYVYAGGKIYIHGAKTGHKVDAVRQCEKVSFCVIAQDDVIPERLSTDFRSVILFGRIRILETEEEIFRAAELLGTKYNPDKERVDQEIQRDWNGLCCMEITVEHLTGKESKNLMMQRNR